MNDLIAKIFKSYRYIEVDDIRSSSMAFYKHELREIANYFIINTVDCRDFEEEEEQVLNALEQLENEYSGEVHNQDISLKQRILDLFGDVKESSQIDKNTSAIYLMLFNNIENLNKYRNAVYSIEESPNYFKRYVLPYTNGQVNQLNYALEQYHDRSINDALCQIVDNPDDYIKLASSKSLDSTYGLVIRMFSKLPFLQYKFKTELAPEPIEKQAEGKLSDELKEYHKCLNKHELTIEDILSLEDDFTLEEEILDKEIQNMLKGVK